MEQLFEIVHEDDELLVINKPADLVCHPTKGDVYSSLISRVRMYLAGQVSSRAEPGSSAASPHLVNRLDRETSGVTVVAKNPAVAGELGRIWETRGVEKEYLAIVHGHVQEERGVIDAPLGKDERSKVVVKDCVRADGAAAVTEFFVERRFEKAGNIQHSTFNAQLPAREQSHADLGVESSMLNVECSQKYESRPFTLLRVLPRTGRKHQIRIHLA
ncbi:MAG: RluA family pseudouridine synthase, partial [Verrucomicrobia bacterium]